VKKEGKDLVIALVGQPNCGKSTLFNAVAGFKVDTGNFPGTTVLFNETKILIGGKTARLIDLPGIYTIAAHDAAEKVARDWILSGEIDVIINVLDATLLPRSLDLTLQLIEMDIPLVIALNMIDEAKRKGVEIDTVKMSMLTGAEVCPLVAVKGYGVRELFEAAANVAQKSFTPGRPVYNHEMEESITALAGHYPADLKEVLNVNGRFAIIRLLEGDRDIERKAQEAAPDFLKQVFLEKNRLAGKNMGNNAGLIASYRQDLVKNLADHVTKTNPVYTVAFRDKLDHFITHPLGAVVTIFSLLLVMFFAAFQLGDIIAKLFEGPLDLLGQGFKGMFSGVALIIVSGLYDGFVTGFGIVIPYLVPLLILLAVFEETGLLPRIAFIMDGILHRFGLHGTSIIPIILGYGCNVPAILATRSLENERDRKITMLIIPFIACSARTVIILALAGKYLGAFYTTCIYIGNVAVSFIISWILTRFTIATSPGIIMDVPLSDHPIQG